MNPKTKFMLGASVALLLTASARAQLTVYENLGAGATAGYSEPIANAPIFGDSLHLSAAGKMTLFGTDYYNSNSGGNTGFVTNGTMQVKFYNNTVAYAGGPITGALLGSATLIWDFSASPLPAGFFSTATFDLSSLNINLTQDILVTEQFTMTSGNSTRIGTVLFNNPTIGTSPNTVYINSGGTAEGLYTFTGIAGQFGFHIEVVPEPATIALAGLGAAAFLIFRRRK